MHLSLPDGFATPPLLRRNVPEINAAVIAMGTACYEAGYNSIVVKENLAARTRESELVQQIADLREALRVSDTVRREALQDQEDRIRSGYETNTAALEEKLAAARQQLEEYQDEVTASRAAAIDEALARERARADGVLAVYKERIARSEAALESATRTATTERAGFMKSINDLRESIHTAEKARLKIQQNSSRKGAAAEDDLIELVRTAVAGWDAAVEKMSTEPESGDIHVIFGDMTPPFRVLVDSKAYTRNVDHAERDKIRHDIETWPGVSAGMLVSMNTGIVGTVDGAIEFTRSGKPLMNMCKLASFTPDQQVRALSLAFAVLRNHAVWGSSQRVLANAHMHVQYYRRTMEQLQNQITAAEKHALVTLRDICGLQNTVTQMRVELMETLGGGEHTLCIDAVSTWWNENYVAGAGTEVNLIEAFTEWRSAATEILRASITKDAFVSLVCGAIGCEPEIVIKSGPGGTKRVGDVVSISGWMKRDTVAVAAAAPTKHYRLVCVDQHTEPAEIRKTFNGLRGILRSKAAAGAGYNWRIENGVHTIYISGDIDVGALPLKTTRSWVERLTIEEVDENPWVNQEWDVPAEITAIAPPKMIWNLP